MIFTDVLHRAAFEMRTFLLVFLAGSAAPALAAVTWSGGGNPQAITQVAMGPNDVACALTDQGEMTCWGDNTDRMLGMDFQCPSSVGANAATLPGGTGASGLRSR